MGSAGGVVAQPVLGRVADVNGYGPAILVSGVVQALAIPFILRARGECSVADVIEPGGSPATSRAEA